MELKIVTIFDGLEKNPYFRWNWKKVPIFDGIETIPISDEIKKSPHFRWKWN